MDTRRLSAFPILSALAAVVVFLSACGPATFAAGPQATTTREIPSTQAPARPTGSAPAGIVLDISLVSQGVAVETVAAQNATAESPYWEAMPQHRRLVLEGYPVTAHRFEPQIFIYPAGELDSANESAGRAATDLRALLETRQRGNALPFLPLLNELQTMDARVQFLDFKNGSGVRFLTQYGQGLVPINNYELFYTFQGLTGDGRYYVSAILPVTSPELPDSPTVSEGDTGSLSNFQDEVSRTVALLNQQDAESFTPDLEKMDALIRSIEVN
ncbi:MAG: hypothetical protein R3335_13710 [Anaerolineales bacterium]|nr:hypothetical protein [Anaerolineales bacterium]